jgi:hypothetical protein
MATLLKTKVNVEDEDEGSINNSSENNMAS